MTFKDLQRLIRPEGESETNSSGFQMLRGKEFWNWSRIDHKNKHRTNKGNCCFNHIIGLPTKDSVEKPMFDYEAMLYKALLEPSFLNSIPKSPTNEPGTIAYPFKHKHLWVKKATGLGITEFMLRFMAWLCLYCDSYRNSQMVIVTGPNQELAIKLIKRAKLLFNALGITFDSKETTVQQYIKEKFAYAKKYNLHVEDSMLVVPVPFSIEGAKMLQHTKWLLDEKDEHGSSLLAIDREKLHKLVTALRTAVANEYKLDKEQTSYNDILDAFRFALQFYKRTKK